MEHLKARPIEEQPNKQHEGGSAPRCGSAGHSEVFEVHGETYEEVSFLYEPMERYKDDILRLDIVIGHKRQLLRQAEEELRAHASVDTDVMHILKDDLERKVAYLQGEVDRLEVVRTSTLLRLGQLARQDRHEKKMLDDCPTDVEH